MNYYLVLDVPTTADADTIRTAFRTLARRYHPDAGTGSSAQRFREVVEAYDTLSDPIRRRRYDETLHTVRVHVRHAAQSPARRSSPEPLIPDHRFRSITSRRQAAWWLIEEDPFDDLLRALEEAFFHPF
jgi:curved DNA-binding protein CbpA